jgi:glycosyltransferase involved in cell wall biosynthesis
MSGDPPTPLHVAILSFGYPPIRHVCGTRASEMGAALVALGFGVTVVTVDWRPSGEDRPPDVVERGVRVVRIDPREWLASFDPTRPPYTTEPESRVAVFRRLRTLHHMLGWGAYATWARRALAELVAVHARRAVDVVWAIHGDDSCHEVAARFSRTTGVPWVADFKDPWNGGRLGPLMWCLRWTKTSRRLKTSAALTETCSGQGELDAQFGRPWHEIWSGYDDAAMASVATVRVSDRFTIGYFGTVNERHDVPLAARSLGAWTAGLSDPSEAEFHVFGYCGDVWREALDRTGAGALLHVHEMIPREQAFSRMKGVDALLLLPLANMGRWGALIGVKELEYLASGTPVLCLGRMAPEFRSRFGGLSQLVEAADETAAAAFLRDEHSRFRAGMSSARRSEVNTPIVAGHAWSAQAQYLADVLKGVVAHRQNRSRVVQPLGVAAGRAS